MLMQHMGPARFMAAVTEYPDCGSRDPRPPALIDALVIYRAHALLEDQKKIAPADITTAFEAKLDALRHAPVPNDPAPGALQDKTNSAVALPKAAKRVPTAGRENIHR